MLSPSVLILISLFKTVLYILHPPISTHSLYFLRLSANSSTSTVFLFKLQFFDNIVLIFLEWHNLSLVVILVWSYPMLNYFMRGSLLCNWIELFINIFYIFLFGCLYFRTSESTLSYLFICFNISILFVFDITSTEHNILVFYP